MKEVEIVCLGDSAHIPDLGLKLRRGAKVAATLTMVSGSRDLAELKRLGVVAVTELKAQAIRRDAPVAQIPSPKNPPPPLPATRPMAPTVPDETAHLLRGILEEIKGLRADLKARPVQEARPEIDLGPMVSAIQSALNRPGVDSGRRVETRHEVEAGDLSREERFIPSGIVSGNLKSEIATQDSSSENSGLDEAEALLKQVRRGAKDAKKKAG